MTGLDPCVWRQPPNLPHLEQGIRCLQFWHHLIEETLLVQVNQWTKRFLVI